jgi:hypothetical protein
VGPPKPTEWALLRRHTHRPPQVWTVSRPPFKKGQPYYSYANLATGRSPGFGSMVGSPEGERRWAPYSRLRSGWLRLSVKAWTTPPGWGGSLGRRQIPSGILPRGEQTTPAPRGGAGVPGFPGRTSSARSRTISRRPIMQKVRVITPLGGCYAALGRKPFQRFFIPGMSRLSCFTLPSRYLCAIGLLLRI